MPRRQYAPVPASQGDADNADRQIEEAFDIGEEDHDDQNHDHTPLLARHDAAEGRTPHASRTPITNRPTTSGGLYNFEYDFPPPGSPPADLAIANTWGNTNGVIISDPVNYNHNSRGNWVTRTWRTLTGTGRQAVIPEAGRVGGGTNNDGVFSNLSSRPTARITRPSAVVVDGTANDDTIFHAPELTRDDVPPSYAAAQADTAPPYWENTVLASAPDDFLIDSIPAGSLLGFIGSMALSVFLEWIGFILAYMLSQSHAGRYGAKAGLGITFVRLGLWFRARGRNWDGNTVPEEMWWPSQSGNGTTSNNTMHPGWQPSHLGNGTLNNANYTGYANFTTLPRHQLENNSTIPGQTGPHHSKIHFTEWLALFLMTVGWFIFMSSLLGFWRVKRWESSIRASHPRVITPEEQQQEREVFTNLQTALGVQFVIRPHPEARSPSARTEAERALRQLGEEEGLRSARSARERDMQPSEEDAEAARFENRLRRDLASLGHI